jgi:hypothetical protein
MNSGVALVAGARPGELVACCRGERRGGVGVPAAPVALHMPPWARYSKDVVFEVCGTLAEAEALLSRSGYAELAVRIAEAFELLEAGLCD